VLPLPAPFYLVIQILTAMDVDGRVVGSVMGCAPADLHT
jgi:hypothetical protein